MFWNNVREFLYAVKHNLKANYFSYCPGITSALGTISGIKSVYPQRD
jgi:hypothetical protein